MEAAQREREVEAERARAAAERQRLDKERAAAEAAAKLGRMQASWRDAQALQQARALPVYAAAAGCVLRASCGLPGFAASWTIQGRCCYMPEGHLRVSGVAHLAWRRSCAPYLALKDCFRAINHTVGCCGACQRQVRPPTRASRQAPQEAEG